MDDAAAAADEPIPRPASTPGRRASSKSRSFSDPPTANNLSVTLAPSPSFRERLSHGRLVSQDDHALPPSTPRPPRRPDFLTRGLTLQLPPRAPSTETPSSLATTDGQEGGISAVAPLAVPLSPKLDSHNIYMHQSPNFSSLQQHSPATSLPRHSRGLDFSRACTTLHHSTVIDQRSPGSSPVITHRAVNIPARKMSVSSMALDSPNIMGGNSFPWGQVGNGGQHPSMQHEKSTVSSSVGSVNMMGSESESESSDDDASMGGDDNDDPVYATPQVHKLQNPSAAATPFALNPPTTPGAAGSGWGTGAHFSPAQASLMKTIRRARLHKNGRRSRKSSSSASGSGYNSMSPRNASPPPLRSIESATGNGYFPWATAARSRRESLAMGADGQQLSSGNDSGDEASQTAPSTPGVVRRPVTRRGNLLPKTKGFARIRAALAEEATPVDTEVRREAETIRQVRERDSSVVGDLDLTAERPQTATAASSPNLLPAVPESAQEDFGRELEGDKGLGMNFAAHASRNSGGLDYWNRFDPSLRTPPPPNFARNSSSVLSDVNMDSPVGDFTQWRRPRARSSASDASEAFQPIGNSNGVPAGVSDDIHLKKFKRRREDDFDIATIKRRAVSPGMSAQNSPVLTHSPSARDNGMWGQPPERKEKKESVGSESHTPHLQPVRPGSGSSTPSGVGNLVSQGKKLGLQPMSDTNDGLMKMSIE